MGQAGETQWEWSLGLEQLELLSLGRVSLLQPGNTGCECREALASDCYCSHHAVSDVRRRSAEGRSTEVCDSALHNVMCSEGTRTAL